MAAAYECQDNVAVIELDNPPVNGLGFATRLHVVESLHAAWADPAVDAIVLIGAGKVFSGGADIREFNTPKSLQEPILTRVIGQLEDSPKPIVAAVHGVAMGGGLELALGCHYRVAVPSAMIALPEVRLGLMPGAGGTQRLPRAVGLARALAMILSGDSMAAKDLADSALFDAFAGDDLRATAVAFAQDVAIPAARRGRLPRLRDIEVAREGADALLAQARADLASQPAHLPAPAMCLDAVAAAVREPLEQGLRRERELFLALLETPQSRALRHVFMSERAASKVEDLADAQALPLTTIAVIGTATRGLDFALAAAGAGFAVLWHDLDGTAPDDAAVAGAPRLTAVTSYAELAGADLLIASSPPGMDADMPMLEDLDKILKAGAILAVDAATTDIDSIASATERRLSVAALHGCRTRRGIAMLEIGRGRHVSIDTVATLLAFAKKMRLPAVVCEGRNGMIGERMRRRYWRHIELLQEEGVPLWRITHALGAFGFEADRVDAPDGDAEPAVADDIIVERLMCALVNEAAHILHEGVARRASDIDLVCLKAHGFPLHTGGPMCYAHERGLASVVEAMQRHGEAAHYASQDWVPSPFLVERAAQGLRFD